MPLSILCLFFLNLSPIDKRVNIVGEEGYEAKHHRQVWDVINGSEYPKHDQYNVVKAIADGVIGATQNRQSGGKETGRYGNGADDQICRVKILQNEIEDKGDE